MPRQHDESLQLLTRDQFLSFKGIFSPWQARAVYWQDSDDIIQVLQFNITQYIAILYVRL